jgi:hypothetical protein
VWEKWRYLWKNAMSFVLLRLSAGRKRLIMKGTRKVGAEEERRTVSFYFVLQNEFSLNVRNSQIIDVS